MLKNHTLTNQQNAEIEISHIMLELEHGRDQHMRHFIDQYYCYKHGFVTKSGRASWGKILWTGYISDGASKTRDKKQVIKEHIVPLKVIISELKSIAASDSFSRDSIKASIDENLIFATITKQEDAKLREHGLSQKMPDDYDVSGSSFYKDKLARYKVSNIDLHFKNFSAQQQDTAPNC